LSSATTADVIIIGTGQAGKPLAFSFAEAGRHTVIIERGHVGGTCVNVGCTPTKAMVASARVAHVVRRAADYGVITGMPRVDLAKVVARKRQIVTSFRDGSRASLEATPNLELVLGQACFTGPKSLRVRLNDGGERELHAETIVINTGARPARPSFEGSDSVDMLDSSSILDLEMLPEHLVVLGGGYIGLEFAQMFRRFGSRVTVVQRSGQLLGREDGDVAGEVASILRDDGVDVLLDTTATRVRASGAGAFTLAVRTLDGERAIQGSHLLAAAGRIPNTEALDLRAAGIATRPDGTIPVDEKLQTTVPGVFAVGDVKGGPQFTHISYDDSRILERNLLHDGQRTTAGRLVPYTVFLDPQLGRVGLTEREARERGLPVRVAKLPMDSVARAIELGETRGFLKVVVERETERILGCAALGIEGGEIASLLQIAIMGRIPFPELRDGVFSHPTLAEALNALFYSFEDP